MAVHRRPWRWRIYRIYGHKQGGWAAESLLSQYPLPDVPASFWWPNAHDIEGLKQYIDAVLQGKETEALEFVDRGQVRNIVLHPTAPCEVYEVSARALVDFLLLRGSISVPINGILRIYTAERTKDDGSSETVYATSDFLGVLAPLLDEKDQELARLSWRRDYRDFRSPSYPLIDTARYAPSTEGALLPSALASPRSAAIPSYGPTAAVSDPPKEREIERHAFAEWVSLITRVDHGEVHYFVRRIYQLQDARLLYVATAWELVGPWHEYQRDNERLLALRIPV